MYKEHFGLTALPFSIAPDPRYLYMSDQHREALAHLVYGIGSDGFILLTGEVGTGKTTVCRCLLEQVPEGSDIAFILNPKVTAEELLASLCDELRITYPEGNRSIKVFVDRINEHLLDAHARGRKTVLIIEEAQNLSSDALEQIRLLTNLETNERKLLQIIMIGQPELREMLTRPEMRQLSQRITARYHLGPLSKNEVASYIAHRLGVAGARRELFSPAAISRVHRLSNGIPRIINLICDRALLGAYSRGKYRVDRPTLDQASQEVFGGSEKRGHQTRTLGWVSAVLIIICFGVALAAAYYAQSLKPGVVTTMTSVPAGIEVKPAEAPKPKLDTLKWPDDKPMDQSRAMAFGAVLKQWDIPYDPENRDICGQVQVRGMRCLQGSGEIKNLIGMDRPAVLKLYDEEGREFFAALTGLDEQTVSLIIAEEPRKVDPKEIEKWWYGEYTVLWQPPAGFRIGFQPGSSGPEVRWIEKQLALIHGTEVPQEKNTLYTDSLVKQVKKFQILSGLVPDGIIGSQTMIHLANAAGSGGPRLKDTSGEQHVLHP